MTRIACEFKAEMDGVNVIGRGYKYSDNYWTLVVAVYINGKRIQVIRESSTSGWYGRNKIMKLATDLLHRFA